MDLGIKGKTAIVCGASQGLGRACAEELAAEGANIIMCSRNFDRIFDTARSIAEKYGVNIVPVAADVSLPDSPEKLMSEAVKKFGGVDILINNAGGPISGVFDELNDEDWENAFHLTLMSAVRMTRAVLPEMQKRHWGRIVNLASISVKQPIPNLMLSNSLRSAVIGMAKTVSREKAGEGILINTIATGYFDTERIQTVVANKSESSGIPEADILAEMEKTVPLGRLGKPVELAKLAAFLSSECASYITGATIQIDGGLCKNIT